MNDNKDGSIMKTITAVTLISLLAIAPAAFGAVQKFSTPEKAVDAFIGALRNYNVDKLLAIFGPESRALFVSEDPVADETLRREFLTLYDAKHQLVQNADGTRTLAVGPDAWPLPIPLAKSGSSWTFNTERGYDEVINRRIGKNELSAIQTILAISDAERDYFHVDYDGDGILEYSGAFRSTVGMRNGLFWPASDSDPESPLGQWVATATNEGYPPASTVYHGYRFRLLRSQGPNAPGGAYDYMVRNDQIGGFAIVAYPAEYGESGVMTFITSHSGVVYQRDLGATTEADVWKLESFDPGEGWTEVSGTDLEIIPEAED